MFYQSLSHELFTAELDRQPIMVQTKEKEQTEASIFEFWLTQQTYVRSPCGTASRLMLK